MLFQFHWQHRDGTTEMRAQKEISSIDEMTIFVKEIQGRHPLPDKAIWMVCNEKSKHFVFQKENKC